MIEDFSGGNFSGPAREQRHADAAFGQHAFLADERRVERAVPAARVGIERGIAAGVDRCSVIAGEKDEGVLIDAVSFQRGENSADAVVDAGDHGECGPAAQGHVRGELRGIGGRQLQRRVRREIIQVEKKGLRVVALEERESGVGLHVDAEAVIFAPLGGDVGAGQIEVRKILVDLAREIIVEALGFGHEPLALGLGDDDAFGSVGLLVREVGRSPLQAKSIWLEMPLADLAAGVAGRF